MSLIDDIIKLRKHHDIQIRTIRAAKYKLSQLDALLRPFIQAFDSPTSPVVVSVRASISYFNLPLVQINISPRSEYTTAEYITIPFPLPERCDLADSLFEHLIQLLRSAYPPAPVTLSMNTFDEGYTFTTHCDNIHILITFSNCRDCVKEAIPTTSITYRCA